MKSRNITPCKQKFNIKNAKKCGAKTRNKTSCKSPAMKNGRCRMHGGKSTGAKTEKGLERIKKSNFRNGFYTKEAFTDRKISADFLRESKKFLSEFLLQN